MTVHKISKHLMSTGKPYMVICPNCDNDELAVMIVAREKRYAMVELRCYSEECRGKPVYDVTGWIATRGEDDD